MDEEFITSTFYINDDVVESQGQEMCIALIALASSGCEANVEGFYSVVLSTRKKTGGQSSQFLCHRAIVDWCLPHPMRCSQTVNEIALIYTEGDQKHFFTDARERATSTVPIDKVVD